MLIGAVAIALMAQAYGHGATRRTLAEDKV
jgi:hypothetical protein